MMKRYFFLLVLLVALIDAQSREDSVKVVIRDLPKEPHQYLYIVDGIVVSYEKAKEIPKDRIEEVTVVKSGLIYNYNDQDIIIIRLNKNKNLKKKRKKNL